MTKSEARENVWPAMMMRAESCSKVRHAMVEGKKAPRQCQPTKPWTLARLRTSSIHCDSSRKVVPRTLLHTVCSVLHPVHDAMDGGLPMRHRSSKRRVEA